MTHPAPPVRVAALYKIAPFGDYEPTRQALDALWRTNGNKSAFLIAREGINGTTGIEIMLGQIRTLRGCATIKVKTS